MLLLLLRHTITWLHPNNGNAGGRRPFLTVLLLSLTVSRLIRLLHLCRRVPTAGRPTTSPAQDRAERPSLDRQRRKVVGHATASLGRGGLVRDLVLG
jgi:hypothetical protein